MDRSREAAVPKIGKNAERWCDSYVSAEKSEEKKANPNITYMGFHKLGVDACAKSRMRHCI
jgi:hypothetical protein